MTRQFNLLDEPWIEVRTLTGKMSTLSLRETLVGAHELRSLSGELVTQQAAILRLLLAILHRTVQVDGYPESTWGEMWRRGRVDSARLDSYLAPHWHRFDLLDETAPFLQVADLRTAKGEFSSLARVIPDVPAKFQYFTTRAAPSYASLDLAEAARWLVHVYAFDPSGIKSGAVGDDRVKGGKGYPIGVGWCGWLGLVMLEGSSLFETLMLNLDLSNREDGDSAVWEREPLTASVERDPESGPAGQVDLLTWPSRRVRLLVEDGRAVGVLLCNGDPLHPRNQFRDERMTAWRRSVAQEKAHKITTVLMPVTHDPDRRAWQSLGSLLAVAPGQQSHEGRSSGVLRWTARLAEEGELDGNHLLRARLVGVEYGSNQSVIDDIYDDHVVLRAAVAADPVLQQAAVDAVSDADLAVRALGDLVRNLVLAAGGNPTSAREAARMTAFDALRRPYLVWLADLGPDTDRLVARRRWQRSVRATVYQLAEELIADAGSPAWAGRRVDGKPLNSALAQRYFMAAVRKALPGAFEPTETGASNDGQ